MNDFQCNSGGMEHLLDSPLRNVLARMQRRIMTQTSWFGVQAFKNPLDFWVYQEILWEQRPDAIIEIGNHTGGSTLALAHLCDLLGHGSVLGIDVDHSSIPDAVRQHPRIVLITGDACASYDRILELSEAAERFLIIEDSAHTYDNTLNVLRTYASLVHPGGYFIVEDGICHHGLDIGPSPGPYEAVHTFLLEDNTFEIDSSRESFVITWNPKGYLRKKQGA